MFVLVSSECDKNKKIRIAVLFFLVFDKGTKITTLKESLRYESSINHTKFDKNVEFVFLHLH